jgi:IS5 family transposase
MRETRNAQSSIFDFYAEHDQARRFKRLSQLLDTHEGILELIADDFERTGRLATGARGLSIESIFRCLILKQVTGFSYQSLAFHLSDSPTYRSFARLRMDQSPSKSGLQATLRHIRPQTLQKIHHALVSQWAGDGRLSLSTLRIDSTVVESHIAPPMDSQLLNDGIRVLSRLMASSTSRTGIKVRFVDQRKRSRSLAFALFHAKKAEKYGLYPSLLRCAAVTLSQIEKAIDRVRLNAQGLSNTSSVISVIPSKLVSQ